MLVEASVLCFCQIVVVDAKELRALCSLCFVEAKGWEWKKLPRKAEDRARLQYNGHGPKVWCSTGAWICKNYLHCLLIYHELHSCQIETIPHYVPQNASKYYLNLLHGEQSKLPSAPLRRLYEDDDEAEAHQTEPNHEQQPDILSDEEEWLAAISAALDEERAEGNAESDWPEQDLADSNRDGNGDGDHDANPDVCCLAGATCSLHHFFKSESSLSLDTIHRRTP